MEADYRPLGEAAVFDIRNIKVGGLLLPTRARDETMLVLMWDDARYGVYLTGDHAFIYWKVILDRAKSGLFIPEPEIRVDFSSIVSARGHEEENGLLVLSNDALSVIATPVGNDRFDAQPVPLWGKVAPGEADENLAFTKWAIGVQNGNDFDILWERERSTQKSSVTIG